MNLSSFRTAVVMVVAGCFAGCATHRPAPVPFPGSARETAAPDARGAIVNVDREQPDAQGNSHTLYFRTPSGLLMPILSYPRRVEILWSPTGNVAAISDARASDDSVCLVFDSTSRRLTDTTPQLEATLPWLADLRRRGQCTIAALGWTKHGDLEVRIDGHAPGGPEVHNLIARVRIAGVLSR